MLQVDATRSPTAASAAAAGLRDSAASPIPAGMDAATLTAGVAAAHLGAPKTALPVASTSVGTMTRGRYRPALAAFGGEVLAVLGSNRVAKVLS
jgi:hypothetical protein